MGRSKDSPPTPPLMHETLICGGRFAVSKDVLGEGTSAVVFRGREVGSGLPVAVKRVALSCLTPAEHKQVSQEIFFLQNYRHRNIIRLLDLERTESYIYLVLECGESDLFTYLSRSGPLPEDQARYIFRQMVSAVSYLHSNQIAHRDLKLENFVITTTGQVKIIDFGLSTRVAFSKKLGDMCGSMAYSPPEIVNNTPYEGTAADIWALGIVLYTLLLGGFPFFSSDPAQMRDEITRGKLRFPKWLSAVARELIVSMLHRNPEHRACIYDVCDHPWLAIDNNNNNDAGPGLAGFPNAGAAMRDGDGGGGAGGGAGGGGPQPMDTSETSASVFSMDE